MLESMDLRLQEAAGNGLTHEEFLELIVQDELDAVLSKIIRLSSRNPFHSR